MKKFILFCVALLLTTPAWSDIFDQIKLARQYELADAYWAAGERFIQLGQKERGAEFQDAATKIFKGFKPGVIPAELRGAKPAENPPANPKVTPAAEPANTAPVNDLTGIPERPLVRERNINGEKIVKLQFSKLIRGFLAEDSATILSVIGKSFKGPGFEKGLTVAEIEAGMNSFFTANDTTRLAPSQLYNFDSLTLTEADKVGSDYILTIKMADTPEAAALAGKLAFFKPVQKFFFAREGAVWKLIGISN